MAMMNGFIGSFIPEMEQIISQLERGTIITRFYPRKKPERKTLSIRRETRQLLWTRTASRSHEGSIEMREVKEIRLGKFSKDFDKWPEESKKIDNLRCFVIFYGSEFKLKVFSVAALSEKECELWLRGLENLILDTVNSPFPLQVERWLRKEFYNMEPMREVVSMKDIKSFLPRVNCKISTSKLREYFQEVDTKKRNEITFDEFVTFYQKLMFDDNIFQDICSPFCDGNDTISAKGLTKFLLEIQGERNITERQVARHMREYLQDNQRDVPDPYFTVTEFMDFLFSRQNDIWDQRYDEVVQDMTRPLSHYWISSSHNTYLTGDQFSSESSVEAYARCLRLGCRCIELDCWDGPEGLPIIYHGHTLTTRIKFMDVINTIKEHAFTTSPYPVILSIEDNCSLQQQRTMANAMQEVFGDLLLTQPVDKNETKLPSPHQLKNKIILKHKKLPEGTEEDSVCVQSEDDMDLRNTVRNGVLYLQDPLEKQWNPHFFVLTRNKLYYTECVNGQNDLETEDDTDTESEISTSSCSSRVREGIPNDELHYGEEWFHGKLPGGRDEAKDLLRHYSHLGDGTFLVRESETFVGDYSLSFWRQDKVNHCRIKSKTEKGKTKYFLIESACFDSLYNLIAYYRMNSLRSQEFHITLKEPVPQPKKHEGKEWYLSHASRAHAEDLLKKVPHDGAFLVRPSDKEQNTYVISFRAEKNIKHCRIRVDGRLYTVGSMQFESLVDLIGYYEKHPLFKKIKLWYPVNETVVQRNFQGFDDDTVSGTPGYMDPSCFISKVTVKAIYDYTALHPDELSFCKHAVITNVDKQEGGWWRGDYGGKQQHWFPSNYVEEIEPQQEREDSSGDSQVLGSLQKGSLDVMGAVVDIVSSGFSELDSLLRIQNPNMCTTFEVAAETYNEAHQWMQSIIETAQNASARENHHKEMERAWRVAKEMSNLIIYCRSVTFNVERIKQANYIYNEMSSFPETKAEKLMCQQESKLFLRYHKYQISRVYPKGQRIDSSNYNPIPMWNYGSQMVALNWQTPDKAMQINQAKFMFNGSCGYVLKPDCMFRESFDPADASTLGNDTKSKYVLLKIIGARHLGRSGRSTTSPSVEVEILGADYDSGIKLTTRTISDNGLNPIWNESCEFEVRFPDIAMIRFVVQDEDMFGDTNFIGQATYPLTSIRTGYRSVPLKNGYSEDLELSSLLVYVSIKTIDRFPNSISSGHPFSLKTYGRSNDLKTYPPLM
ncbi:1-phosphatidylinositol 4,5-bisphosphate phosphodiesterase gamma-1 [Planococcus citri]|uniref:1-phosphatidylinositol 4,5-bisphosphate phosphodiesterase gamma-1 n=1 Tax=Planococcus citri TaxID=170843 RepID=UPI0031F958EC